MFLHKSDYRTAIEDDDLEVVSLNDSIRLEKELEAQEEIESYLRERFDEAKIFINLTIYDFTVTYAIGDLVILDAAEWEASKSYVADNLVEFNGDVFKNILATSTQDPSDAVNWTKVGVQFDKFVAVTAESGNHVDDIAKWTPGDSRSLLIRQKMVDITLYELHSHLNPRQIPEHRLNRRDDAISWLKKVSNPKHGITPDLPLKVFGLDEGNDITWSSNTKRNH